MNKQIKRILIVSFLIVVTTTSFGVYWFNRKFEVIFINSDNSIIERKEVKYGESINDFEIPIVPEGYKFTCWDKSLKKIKKNTIVKAIVEEIDNGINVISLGNSYASKNKTFSIPLILSGDVDICSLELIINFDSKYLTFKESLNEDSEILVNGNDNDVYVSFASAKNVKTTVYMCDLVFSVNEDIDESALLQININKCGKYEEDRIVDATYSTIDGIIYSIS